MYKVIIPSSYHELDTPARGYLEHVQVIFPDGRSYDLTFLDRHNFVNYHSIYFRDQQVVIIKDVTIENIHAAVKVLSQQHRLGRAASVLDLENLEPDALGQQK